MKATGPSSAQTDQRKIAHARRKNERPTYIGLRVIRNMPELTSEDADSGLVGLIVVRARRNETTPATLKNRPTIRRAEQTISRSVGSIGRNGATKDMAHIPNARTAPTMGGGILSSSDVIS